MPCVQIDRVGQRFGHREHAHTLGEPLRPVDDRLLDVQCGLVAMSRLDQEFTLAGKLNDDLTCTPSACSQASKPEQDYW
jgi:hypothetical protein